MMSASVLEAVLRRDRAVIIAAISLLTVLAWTDLVWLAEDMSMGGMDMTGFRMIPAGQGLMMPASEPQNQIFCLASAWRNYLTPRAQGTTAGVDLHHAFGAP
jgi:predicted metal-binding membrane protein